MPWSSESVLDLSLMLLRDCAELFHISLFSTLLLRMNSTCSLFDGSVSSCATQLSRSSASIAKFFRKENTREIGRAHV